MPLPPDFRDDDAQYSLRVCMLLEQASPASIATNSKVYACDNCDRPIWVNESQPIPPHPEGLEWTGHVNLCMPCAAKIIAEDGGDVSWMGNLT